MTKQHLRPMEWAEGEELRFGPFRLIPRERRLEREGKPVRIGDRALDVLLCLIANAPDVVTKGALMEQVWPNLIVEEGNLRYQVAALRRALEDGADSSHYVTTVQGRGHVFIARVSRSLGVEQRCDPMDPDERHRLPGVGRTTVAAALADARLSALKGTSRFVGLGALTDALDPATLASMFGLNARSADPGASLASLLRDKRILLILDNGEHAGAAARVAET
jgi:DNA-binding winged helix-turn-helix (wHTH) protein